MLALSLAFSLAILGMADPSGPLPPPQEAARLRLADPNLTIELVAAEPDVISPVAMAWDAAGRLFVAEMRDYPNGPNGGQIRLLTDPDADGRYRKSTVFASKLPFPNSVQPWRNGVFVTAAPDLWYLRDRDRDGVADERHVVLTGFRPGNQQLRANGLTWGIDGWIYGANGRGEGAILRPGQPSSSAVSLRGRDFRFRPDESTFETVSGPSQFGLARDDWGNRFLSWNTVPFRHVILEQRYLNRNPHLAETPAVPTIADPADPNRLFAISPKPSTFNREAVDVFNASCGTTIYRGHALGPDYAGNIFVCEPLTNLVHRRKLVEAGATFLAKRADDGKEFLSSTDPWFHPVNLATGPDGAFYVADFYRRWVEHPDFVPQDQRGSTDWRAGWEHGRIWRIRPRTLPATARPDLSPTLRRATTQELIKTLEHPNGWQRDTAQRLLIEQRDLQAIDLLRAQAQTSESPQARLLALWVLERCDALDEVTLDNAIHSAYPRVRAGALALFADRAPANVPASLLIPATQDPHAYVRLQALLNLFHLKPSERIPALAASARRDADDEWMRLAILSNLKDEAWPLLKRLATIGPASAPPSAGFSQFLTQLAAILGTRDEMAELAECLTLLAQDPNPNPNPGDHDGRLAANAAILASVAEGLERAGRSPRGWLKQPPAELRPAIERLRALLLKLEQLAAGPDAVAKTSAVRALVRWKPDALKPLIIGLLAPDQPQSTQFVAAQALGETDLASADVIDRVVERFPSLSPQTRFAAVDALAGRPETAKALLTAMDQRQVRPDAIDLPTRSALLNARNPDLRALASRILGAAPAADRAAALRDRQAAAALSGDRQRGEQLFAMHCRSCHQWRGQGHRIGPDLANSASSKTKERLLVDVLDPNRDVPPDSINYVVIVKDGRTLSGIIAGESETAIRLRRAEGVEDVIPRAEIEELRSTGKSLMPEGFEQSLNAQSLADLLEFLTRPVEPPQRKD